MVKLPWGKSKEDLEIERKIRARKAKSTLISYISNLEKLEKRIFELGKEAAKINDAQLVRRQATKYIAMQARINQARKLLILMEEAEAQKELMKVSGAFISFSRDIVDSIAEGPGIEDMAKMQTEFEQGMVRVEHIEESLTGLVDMASENILTSGDFGEETVDDVVNLLEGTAGVQNTIDVKIEDKLKEVEQLMKGG
jgi:hypothetical protein